MKQRSSSHRLARGPQPIISALGKELAELHVSSFEEEQHHRARDASDCPKPFAAFGSFRQRHGDSGDDNHLRTIEAPAKLESSASARLSQSLSSQGNFQALTDAHVESTGSMLQAPATIWKCLNRGKSSLSDLDREEAWERKKAQYLPEEDEEGHGDDEEYSADEGFYDALSDQAVEEICSSDSDEGSPHPGDDKDTDKHTMEHDNLDCASHSQNYHIQDPLQSPARRVPRKIGSFRKKPLPMACVEPTRTRSLTDEDLEELRGSIDLGFGFSYNERCNLTSTLPALELYYAINKNYVEARSSPVSPLEGNALLRTSSAGSTSSPSSESWRISSPGDHPSQVKTRLRHWAQAVACSVKQGY